MRDIAITIIVLVGCLQTIKRPYIGVLLWAWLSYMNPHRLAYGFAYNMPFAQITAIILLVSTVFSKERQRIPMNSITILWMIYIFYMALTSAFAVFSELAWVQYIKVIKIQLVIFLTMVLITDMEKLKQLLWVIVLSLGYFSVKGGIFTILTGGGHKVYGPNGSFIEDNNSLAIAVLMAIPMMTFLRQISLKKWVKLGFSIAIATSAFTVLGSQSRGALLAILAVAFFFWIKSKNKLITGVVITVFGLVLLGFMPDTWFKRMNTINTYEEDGSAMGRINAWEYAYNAANHNIFGMGFESWSYSTFALYAPNPEDVHAAHSIYFSVLADHGWIGLAMFVSILIMSWRMLSKVVKESAKNIEYSEINLLAKMLQVSFIAYIVGGTFLSLSYFDLPWHMISFVVLLKSFMERKSMVRGRLST